MATSGERKALIFLASLGALGLGVRGCRDDHRAQPPAVAPGGAELARQIEAVDSAIATGGAKRARRSARPAGDSVAARRGRTASRRGTGTQASGVAGARSGGDSATAGDTRRNAGDAPRAQPPGDARDAYRRRVLREDSARFAANERVAAANVRALEERALRERALQAGVRAFGAGGAPEPAVAGPAGRRSRGGASAEAGPPVDMDVASESAIERLPYVGAELARKIVADRAARGPFGSIEGLRRVPGVGASVAAKLAPHVTFSLAPRQGSAGETIVFRRSRRPRGDPRP